MPAHTCVIIPALDERSTIADVVARARGQEIEEVIVVDDCSRDDTAAIARQAGATVLRLPIRLGAWGATQTGLRYALRHGYRRAVTMDGDDQHPHEDIPRLLAPLYANEADVVIGACTARASKARRIAWAWFRSLTGIGIEDITSGYRAYNHRAMRLLASPGASLLDYQDIGILLMLLREGLRIREVPVAMSPRRGGDASRIFDSWGAVFRYMLQTTVITLARADRPLKFRHRPKPQH